MAYMVPYTVGPSTSADLIGRHVGVKYIPQNIFFSSPEWLTWILFAFYRWLRSSCGQCGICHLENNHCPNQVNSGRVSIAGI